MPLAAFHALQNTLQAGVPQARSIAVLVTSDRRQESEIWQVHLPDIINTVRTMT